MAVVYSKAYEIGSDAIDFNLPDTAGEKYTLAKFTEKKGLLIVFTCNHCPYARASFPVLIDIHRKYSDQISVIAINPNDERVVS